MATKNSTLLGKFYLSGTTDQQQRLGDPTQQSLATTSEALFDPYNNSLYNDFANFMINQIGLSFARQQRFKNPLREYIKDKLYYGSTVTETQLNWIKGHSYNVDAEEQFKTHYPDGLQAFHTMNYEMQYPISVSREQMRQAVNSEYGLNSLASAIFQQPINADEYDMFNAMFNLFKTADDNYKLYREHLDLDPIDEEGCKKFLEKVQQLSYDLTVPTTLYSCTDLPVVVEQDEMVLFIRSDVMASTNVQALAVLFNMEKADIPYKTKVIPKSAWTLGDQDYAILTTSDFFQVYTIDYCTSSQWDAQGLKTNYWLTDRATISFSPFVPVIVFSSDPIKQTNIPTVTLEATGFNLSVPQDVVHAGDTVPITATLNGTITPLTPSVDMKPNAYTYTLELGGHNYDRHRLNSRTYIDNNSVLHIQKSDLEATNCITIKAKALKGDQMGNRIYEAEQKIWIDQKKE